MFEDSFLFNEVELTETIYLLHNLRELLEKLSLLIGENPDEFAEYYDPLVLSTEALEYMKKYRLHKLEENPNDLPEKDGLYLVAYYNIKKMPKGFLEEYDGYTSAYYLCEDNIAPLSYMEAQYLADKHEFKLPVNYRAVAWRKIDLN